MCEYIVILTKLITTKKLSHYSVQKKNQESKSLKNNALGEKKTSMIEDFTAVRVVG